MNDLNNVQNFNSYEQKKNNGKGVFYGVIAVATLIVAIIGATFAYFTAQNSSTTNALSATAATVSINYTEGRSIQATNLIPASADVVAAAYSQPTAKEYNENPRNNLSCTYNSETDTYSGEGCKNKGDVGTKCVDNNGYFVCAWYEFSVTNESNISQAINAYMTINTNTFTTLDTASIAANDGVFDSASGNYTSASRAVYSTDQNATSNDLALKFMTVRSADTVDVNAEVCATQKRANDNLVTTTDFCDSTGDEDDHFTTSLSGITTAEKNSDSTVYEYLDTATNRKYYSYNTTAVRQSMAQQGQQQTIFTQESIPTAPTDATGAVRTDCDADGVVGAGNLTCGTTRTFYVLVWLEENKFVGTYQANGETYSAQDIDQGKKYAATITVQATGNGGYVTGDMND